MGEGKTPCYKCKRRQLSCHSTCKDYLTYSNKIKKANKNEKEEGQYYALFKNRKSRFKGSFK